MSKKSKTREAVSCTDRVRPCVTHHHSCDCRERAIRALLEEVMWWHSDPTIAEYNGCDTEPCLFCELAKGLLDGTKNHDEIVRKLHGPNAKVSYHAENAGGAHGKDTNGK